MVPSGGPVLRDVLRGSLDAVAGRANALGLPQRRGVVVLVVDGLGDRALSARSGHARALVGGDRRRIVTGAPTTTAAALTTLATGEDPGVHGVVAYAALDPAADRVVNQLHGFDLPAGAGRRPSTDSGLRPELPDGWQRSTTVFERAAAEGVAAFAVGPRHYATSGFTREVLRGARYVGARSIDERLEAAWGAVRGAKGGIAYCYVPELDVVAHRDGWTSNAWTDLLETADGAVRDAARDLRRGETLLVTADHGMVDVPRSAHVVLEDEPGLLDGIRHVAGEPRLLHLHLEPGVDPASVARRLHDVLGDRGDVRTRAAAVEEGWFGAVDAAVAPRIGDVLVAARGTTACYVSGDSPARGMVGQHGAWTDAERLVPLIRFDA